MATNQVLAPLVQFRLEDGTYVHVYEGGPVPEAADKQQLKQLRDAGMVGVPGTKPASADPAEDDDDRPAGNASRDEWEAYALAHDRTEDELAELGRDEIRDLFA